MQFDHFHVALFIPLLLALAYRSRGAAHPWGTTINRIVSWAVPVAAVCTAIAYFHNYPLWFGAISGVLAFAGCCIGHSSFQTDTRLSNFFMAIYCTVLLTGILAPFIYADHFNAVYAAGGLLGGVAYYLGYRIPFGIGITVPGDVSWGEFLTGLLAFGLPLGVLCGV